MPSFQNKLICADLIRKNDIPKKGFTCIPENFYLVHYIVTCQAHPVLVKATTGVCEAHLHQAYKPCFIGAIQSQT